ncbi:MAG: ferrous iron transport protein B [Thermoleophilia bacterium]|nr:ferrous iron transport protein B [Thermoleophilia bacterium]
MRAPGQLVRVGLAGQPNVGKSTVFNALTGLNQHVGNWPGKTVEKKTGRFVFRGREYEVVDLPGTYSLTSGSEEERIARDYLLKERPDVVVAVVNAAALERNLYLVAELLLMPIPLVVALNMIDVAEAHGIHVEAPVLQAALGVPVVPLVASKGSGLVELMEAIEHLAQHPELSRSSRPAVREKHRPVLEQIRQLLEGKLPWGYPLDWTAVKLLEGDTEVAEMVQQAAPDIWPQVKAVLAGHDDAFLDIAGGRYDWIGRMVRAAVVQPRRGVTAITDRIDRVATHPFWGLVMLIAAMAALFGVTYFVAGPAAEALSELITGRLAGLLRELLGWAPGWVSGVLADGVVGGAGTVLSFLPILVVFFAALGLLEDVGYMTRAAYVTDRYMHWMGLHGKSCMPLILGFGCNVPAVLGSRIIEERRARLLTILLTPFIPCSGRLAVLAFLAPAFFGSSAIWASLALVGGNLVVLAVVGIAVNKLVFGGERSALIMEMPLYHAPNARTIGLYVWRNTLAFVKKAGTLIVVVSAVVWVLSNYPGKEPSASVLGILGRGLEPIGALMGLGDWRLMVALLSSFVAKENSVATLAVVFGAAAGGGGLAAVVAGALTPPAAAAFLVVQMTFVPCVATLAAIRQESQSWGWLAASIGLMLVVSLLLGTVVFRLGSLL